MTYKVLPLCIEHSETSEPLKYLTIFKLPYLFRKWMDFQLECNAWKMRSFCSRFLVQNSSEFFLSLYTIEKSITKMKKFKRFRIPGNFLFFSIKRFFPNVQANISKRFCNFPYPLYRMLEIDNSSFFGFCHFRF